MSQHPQTRFTFLLSILLVLVVVLSACGSPAAPAEAPEAEAPASAAPAAPAPQTEAPATEAPAEAASSPAMTTAEYQAHRADCTWAAPCWPQIVNAVPGEFHEAPMLAAKVAAGELPPVDERLPLEPLVIAPPESVGPYGGIWRRAFTGPGDRQNFERMINDYNIYWDTAGAEVVPRILKSWEQNADATEYTFHLREGTKWSDGTPFTTADYMFWYEHILKNETLTPTQPWWINWGSTPAVFEPIDDFTFRITFSQSFPSWLETMASSGVAGHYNKGVSGGSGALYAPAHYLEQFHPDFIGEEKANELAKEAGFEAWHLNFLSKNDAHMNPDVPVMTPWMPVTTIASQEYVLERNPYFWAVDSEGNQLPYFDGVSGELVEELEVLNLRAIAGNYTLQGRHIDFSKLPVIRENEVQGDYFVDFWTNRTRHQAKIAFNQDWNEEPEIAGFLQNRDFRKALSLSIERDEINETYFLGQGTEASFCPQETPPYFNSSRWDDEFGRYATDEANALLDGIGLDQRDGEGYRLLPSGQRLILRIDAVSGAFIDYPSIAESVGQMWKDGVGVQLQVNPVERSLWQERMMANQPMMNMFATGSWTPDVSPTLLPTERWAPLAAAWASDPNPDPAEYDGPQWIKDLVAKHWAAVQETDPAQRRQLYIEGTEIMCDAQARLGMVVNVPDLTVIIKNQMRNVPRPLGRDVYDQTPGHGYPETWSVVQE